MRSGVLNRVAMANTSSTPKKHRTDSLVPAYCNKTPARTGPTRRPDALPKYTTAKKDSEYGAFGKAFRVDQEAR